ncbi:transposase [Pseudoxanthomonas mexicana]
MPRLKRLDLPGVAQHVVQRGNDKQACFFRHEDYVRYLQDLREAALKFGCRVHAYVLMTNHVHLLVTPSTVGATSRMMQAVGRRYVRYVNDTIGRTGTLWEGRYKSSLVDSERYVMACYRYIELNPVRAGMVAEPAHYPWSSYGCNGLGRHDPVVSAHELYRRIAQNAAERCALYRELVSQALPDDDIAAIRQYMQRQRALGSSSFQVQIEQQLQRRAGLGRPGRPAKEKVL